MLLGLPFRKYPEAMVKKWSENNECNSFREILKKLLVDGLHFSIWCSKDSQVVISDFTKYMLSDNFSEIGKVVIFQTTFQNITAISLFCESNRSL